MSSGPNIGAVAAAELVRSSVQIADRAAICDIEMEAAVEQRDLQRWYDIRPMVDEREHSPQTIDMNRQSLDYALMRGLAQRHPQVPHLVRISHKP